MEMAKVKSSNISAAGYDPATKVLRIRFSNGTDYDYKNVSAEKYSAFMAAESQGRYFHQNIKGVCTCTKCKKG